MTSSRTQRFDTIMRMSLTEETPAVQAEGVSFSYGAEPVLEDVGLAVGPGEFVALAGPNGSGKSTLVRILMGLLPSRTGTVEIFGERPARRHDRWRVGYVPQQARLAPDLPVTVEEVVADRTARRSRDGGVRPGPPTARRSDHALDSVALTDLRRRPSASSRAGSSNACSSPKHSRTSPGSSSSTNRSRASTRRRSAYFRD